MMPEREKQTLQDWLYTCASLAKSPHVAPYLLLVMAAFIATGVARWKYANNGPILLPSETVLKVDLNNATYEELRLLPGIGAKLASDIVEYRKRNGEFQTLEELMKIRGLKTAKFNQIKDFLTLIQSN